MTSGVRHSQKSHAHAKISTEIASHRSIPSFDKLTKIITPPMIIANGVVKDMLFPSKEMSVWRSELSDVGLEGPIV